MTARTQRLAVRSTVQTCTECNKIKPIAAFGKMLVCNECRAARSRSTVDAAETYDGAELRPFDGRPGAMRAFDLPSRVLARRFYRDGRVEEIEDEL